MPTPSTFTFIHPAGLLHSVGNPIVITANDTAYTIGAIFFCEVWATPSKDVYYTGNSNSGAILLQTLRTNGDGAGNASFDISGVLTSRFRSDTVTVPTSNASFQKDESCYTGFFVRVGTIVYNSANVEVKTYEGTTDIQFALRAALRLNAIPTLGQYVFYGDPIQYLTNIPGAIRRKRNEPTFLPLFIPINAPATATMEADLLFRDGTTEALTVISEDIETGGVFIFNAKATMFQGHAKYNQLVSFTVYATLEESTGAVSTLTETRQIMVDEDISFPTEVKFMNRKGSFDVIHFNNDYDTTMKVKPQTFNSGYGQRTYQTITDTTTVYYSGWLSSDEYNWLKDLVTSPFIVINGNYIRQDDYKHQINTRSGLFRIELSVKPDVEENTIKL